MRIPATAPFVYIRFSDSSILSTMGRKKEQRDHFRGIIHRLHNMMVDNYPDRPVILVGYNHIPSRMRTPHLMYRIAPDRVEVWYWLTDAQLTEISRTLTGWMTEAA